MALGITYKVNLYFALKIMEVLYNKNLTLGNNFLSELNSKDDVMSV